MKGEEKALPDIPIGTRVRYWSVSRKLKEFRDCFIETETRSLPYFGPRGNVLIFLVGVRGFVWAEPQFFEVIEND
jgi:hypothetical protein